MAKFILALDQGTTGSTAALINSETLELVGHANHEFPQIYPKPASKTLIYAAPTLKGLTLKALIFNQLGLKEHILKVHILMMQ